VSVRVAVGAIGMLMAAYGAFLLLSRQGFGDWVEVAAWLAVAVGATVLATTTLLAVPVLGRFGARVDNPTLLDRNYVVGWLVLAMLIAVGVVVGTLWRSRRLAEGDGRGPRARG
jgi:hypothetical protein